MRAADATASRGDGAQTRGENVPLGIACMIGATLMFSVSAAIMKIEVARYPIGEVMAGVR